MRQVIAKKWAAALRSGEYLKVKGALHMKGYGYCALGVLCDLAPPSVGTWQNGFLRNGQAEAFGPDKMNSSINSPVSVVDKWAKARGYWDEVIALNDTADKPFNEIADYIEENYKTL